MLSIDLANCEHLAILEQHPEMVESINIGSDCKVFINHLFYEKPFFVGIISPLEYMVMNKKKYKIKKWRLNIEKQEILLFYE